MDTDLSFVHSNFPIRYFYISRLVRSVAKSSFGIQIRADLFPFIFPFAPLVEQFFRKRRIKYETISLRGELPSRFNKWQGNHESPSWPAIPMNLPRVRVINGPLKTRAILHLHGQGPPHVQNLAGKEERRRVSVGASFPISPIIIIAEIGKLAKRKIP